MKNISTQKLILSALLMALTIISTMFIRIPILLGYVNLGDAFVFLSAFILGPILGTIIAGVGCATADLFGYITYTPGTLIIKMAMALVACLLNKVLIKATGKRLLAEIIAGIIGTIIMAFGYFIYETLFFSTAVVAIVNVPWNLLQGAVGIFISIIIMRILSSTKILEKIQN